MLNADQRYRAYQLLRELDKTTSSLMNRVAYSHAGKQSWEEDLQSQRAAFEEWMAFAKTISDDL
jgi:hypothetical protein